MLFAAAAVVGGVTAAAVAVPYGMRWIETQRLAQTAHEQPETAPPAATSAEAAEPPVKRQPTQAAPAAAVVPRPGPTEKRRLIAAEAPTGRLFEPPDVDESPAVATRVEPKIPRNVPSRLLDDVVVVRLLVSQTGHPFRISLLRRSRVGPSVDDAVVAAVTQWTFSPARKRGEAVSCWYNVAVPLGQSE